MTIKEKIFCFAKCLIDSSNGAIRMAFQEEDDTTEVNKEAANFLKNKGNRLGRDLELYAFMGEITSVPMMLTNLLTEIFYPIQKEKWSKQAADYLKTWGVEVNEGENKGEWIKLFV